MQKLKIETYDTATISKITELIYKTPKMELKGGAKAKDWNFLVRVYTLPIESSFRNFVGCFYQHLAMPEQAPAAIVGRLSDWSCQNKQASYDFPIGAKLYEAYRGARSVLTERGKKHRSFDGKDKTFYTSQRWGSSGIEARPASPSCRFLRISNCVLRRPSSASTTALYLSRRTSALSLGRHPPPPPNAAE